MDEHRHNILVALVFFMMIWHINSVGVQMQHLAFHQHYNPMMMVITFITEANVSKNDKLV
jgi:hypothetical protein